MEKESRNKNIYFIVLVAFLIFASAYVVGNESKNQSVTSVAKKEVEVAAVNDEGVRAEVVYVVDGDTLKISLNSVTETVRVVGIDTPEISQRTQSGECYGEEASIRARELLSNKTITFYRDETQDVRDDYGRLLGYITLPSGDDFGNLMISQGYALEFTFKYPYKKQQIYQKAERYAKSKKIGLWAHNACDDF